MSDLTDQVESLRGLLSEREFDAMAAFVAEVEEAAASPAARRRWEKKLAEQEALRNLADRTLAGRHGSSVLDDEDFSL
jgi:hypothetical protein